MQLILFRAQTEMLGPVSPFEQTHPIWTNSGGWFKLKWLLARDYSFVVEELQKKGGQ